MKYAHNVYWAKNPIQDTINAGLEALEFDLQYRMFSKRIFCSHSWRPANCMYYGELIDYLKEIIRTPRVNYLILEPKTFTIDMEVLAEMLLWFKTMCELSQNDVTIVMSVQYKKGFHQKLRGRWLDKFFRLYKEELGILDKRLETDLHEQVDLYEKKWYHF